MTGSQTKDNKSFKMMQKTTKPLSKAMKARTLNHTLTLLLYEKMKV